MAIAHSLKNYLEEQGVQYDVVRHVHTESSSLAMLHLILSCVP